MSIMKKSKSKDAKFFCESCGSEVSNNAKFCPTCGKFFAAVRCPKCGRTGTNDDFKDGCPTCGYAVNPGAGGRNSAGFSNISFNNDSQNDFKGSKSGLLSAFSFLYKKHNLKTNSAVGSEKLPVWVYVSSLSVLAVLVVCLYSCL